MKTRYIVVLVDGAADEPLERMGGRTPLEVARKPVMDKLAAEGRCGTLVTVPDGFSPDSAVANLSILGYDPEKTYEGRGVLEAASLGVPIEPGDVAMRCNLVCVQDDAMCDHSAGHIGSAEAAQLLASISEELGSETVVFHPGTSYRHLLILKGGHSKEIQCFPPHDFVGQPISALRVLPQTPSAVGTAQLLNQLIEASAPILAGHPINLRRAASQHRQATHIWPWAAGYKPEMETIQSRFGIQGAVISAVDLIHGLGRLAGMTSLHVEGATGLFDTNYEGKAAAAIEALNEYELVYVHLEGPDEAGHARDLGLKIHCIESIDRRILAPIVAAVKERDHRTVIAVLPDHYTPVEQGNHVGKPVPVLIHDPAKPADGVTSFHEKAVRNGGLGQLVGVEFMETLLG
ncbi:MAG: cofactor-independent phosphoglycerate mutase, partial [Proteobacteria bacterium]|nr:cofactor-independent phosphoglycerate mutase [Pseudomonadota bacterium]